MVLALGSNSSHSKGHYVVFFGFIGKMFTQTFVTKMYVTNVTVLCGDYGFTDITSYDILEVALGIHGQALWYMLKNKIYLFQLDKHSQTVWSRIKCIIILVIVHVSCLCCIHVYTCTITHTVCTYISVGFRICLNVGLSLDGWNFADTARQGKDLERSGFRTNHF